MGVEGGSSRGRRMRWLAINELGGSLMVWKGMVRVRRKKEKKRKNVNEK